MKPAPAPTPWRTESVWLSFIRNPPITSMPWVRHWLSRIANGCVPSFSSGRKRRCCSRAS